MYDILLTQIMNIFIEHWYINFSNYIYLFYDNNDKQFNDIKFITITYLLWYLNVRDTYNIIRKSSLLHLSEII